MGGIVGNVVSGFLSVVIDRGRQSILGEFVECVFGSVENYTNYARSDCCDTKA